MLRLPPRPTPLAAVLSHAVADRRLPRRRKAVPEPSPPAERVLADMPAECFELGLASHRMQRDAALPDAPLRRHQSRHAEPPRNAGLGAHGKAFDRLTEPWAAVGDAAHRRLRRRSDKAMDMVGHHDEDIADDPPPRADAFEPAVEGVAAAEPKVYPPADHMPEERAPFGGDEGDELPTRLLGTRRTKISIGSGPAGMVRRDVDPRAGPCGAGQREGGHAIHGGERTAAMSHHLVARVSNSVHRTAAAVVRSICAATPIGVRLAVISGSRKHRSSWQG